MVTGATGFIGSHVARLAVERGDEVVLGVEQGSDDDAIADLDCRRVRIEVTRPALRSPCPARGRAGVPLRRRDLGAPA